MSGTSRTRLPDTTNFRDMVLLEHKREEKQILGR